ncbi:hypothetical protein MPDQ_006098 [Monascus purpureus]|uniref:Zona occludens toxin N-terminal domain-containing protein n=1 Tax=Monascus purpureus TaxID=5098 RepID=A0A507R2I6_MONPU|nr:hypothetical protein MPDQ_006098 [Monascus purpureus]
MRLEVLESFFGPGAARKKGHKKGPRKDPAMKIWEVVVTPGRIIALDEAHKFLDTSSVEAVEFTETLLSIVRQQRHLGARVMIATQEPTVSPALLDLCNVTIIHRFNSPAWYKAIEAHIAGAAMASRKASQANASDLFQQIVQLATGEALVFCPTALLKSTGYATDVKMSEDEDPKTSNTIWASLAGSRSESRQGFGSKGRGSKGRYRRAWIRLMFA